jgi:lipopolysaccharide export system permease protein
MTSASYNFFKSLKLLVPRPALMDRYITAELLLPFLFGVAAFSSVLVAVGTVFDLVRKVVESGLPMAIAINVFLLKLPSFIVLAFPMSTLLAALITYSRLSSDSELIALRSCGVSIYRIVLPALVLSCVVLGMTFLFNEHVVPAANYQATLTLDKALKEEKPTFQQQNIFYPEYQEIQQPDGNQVKILTRLFYADQFDGQRMRGLTIIDRSREGLNQIVVAESAMWNPKQNLWDFFNGTIYLVSPDSSYRNIVRFEQQKLQLPRTPLDVAGRVRDSDEMNIAEVREQLELARLTGDESKIRRYKLRIQEKIAFPFICVVFGLVGATLGTNPQRQGRATSFGISVVVIFLYYSLTIASDALGLKGVLSPWLAAWLPNIFGFGAAGLLLLRAAR